MVVPADESHLCGIEDSPRFQVLLTVQGRFLCLCCRDKHLLCESQKLQHIPGKSLTSVLPSLSLKGLNPCLLLLQDALILGL